MNAYENVKAKNWTLADECAGLDKEPGICIDDRAEDGTYQVTLFKWWSMTDAEILAADADAKRLAAECAGLKDEPGVYMGKLNSDFPVMQPGKDAKARADACQDYMAVLFAEWYMADGGRKLYEIDDRLEYAIFEKSYFHSLSKSKQKVYRDMYGRFCVVVSDYFYDWVNIWKYKLQTSPLAQLWVDECGNGYRIDTNRGKGYMLTRVGQDKALGTTADYWLLDKDDVMLKSAVDRFAEKIGKTMDKLPTKAQEKRGPGRPPKQEEPKEGTPAWVENERDKVMRRYKDFLEKRYASFAGYERNKIIERIKEKKMVSAVTMNDLQHTGSLVPMVNCLYDLHTGKPRSAKPEDYISAYAPTWYNPDATDEHVARFINQFTCDRADLQDFLFQVLGVGLDLNMLTRTLCELWGETTTNGKSTLVKALVACLGKGVEHGLACELPPTVIGMSANSNDDSRITPSLGMIGASRLMFASEPKAGMKVDWALVKRLTGGDIVSVNEKYEKQYNIDARASMVLDCNTALRVDDHTLFSRGTIQIIPCDFQVTEDIKDKELDAKLSTENAKSTLMNMMLAGYKSYINNGKQFTNPPCVQAALVKNKEQSDRIGCFVKENYVLGQAASKKVKLRQMWEDYVEWCRANGYQHPEVYSSFVRYFESKPNTYTVGDDHKQKALCGIVKLSMTEEIHQVITGDPIEWYIRERLVEEPQSDGQQADVDGQTEPVKTIKLATIHNDYKRMVTDAGSQAIEFWPFYGVLMGMGWNITMGNPGDPSTIEVTGWHIASKSELKKKQEEKVKAKADRIRQDVKDTLAAMYEKDRWGAVAIKVLMRRGLNELLDGASDEARRVIVDAVTTGMYRELIINAIAHE